MEENKVHSNSGDVDKQNVKRKSKKATSLISDYAERTTLHGFYYIVHGGNRIRQLVWLLFILCSFAYFAHNTAGLVKNFLAHKKLTRTEIISSRKMKFPAITICNYNPVSKKKKQEAFKDLEGKPNISGKNWQSSQSSGTNFSMKVDFDNVDIDTLYQKFGHTMDEDGMLVGCKWKGKACTEEDFRSSAQSMGLCHTFNSGEQHINE